MTDNDLVAVYLVFLAFIVWPVTKRCWPSRRAEPPPEPTVRVNNVRAGRSVRVTGDRAIEVRDGRVYVDGVEWGPKGRREDRP